jgi:hypothetical protein
MLAPDTPVATNECAPRLRTATDATRHWTPGTRFAFRAWFVLAILVVLPRSVEFFLHVGVWPLFLNWAGRWPIIHLFHRPEHQLAGPMSGADNLPDFVAAATLGGLSLIVATVWSIASRSDERDRRLFVWLYTIVRFALGSLLLYYAWDKILPAQFGSGPNLEKVIRPVAQLTPMELLWAFMSVSRPYAVFSGAAELAGGVLLFTRRTALLGAIIATIAMANVLMLDLSYDVGVKFLAGQMFVMALSLVVPYAVRLGQVLILHRPDPLAPVGPLALAPPSDRIVRAAGIVFGAIMIVWTYGMAREIMIENTGVDRLFHGVWEVEAMERGGTPVPLLVTDYGLWRSLVFPADDSTASVIAMSGAETSYRVRVDSAAGTLTLTPRPASGSRATRATWAFIFPAPDRLEMREIGESTAPISLRLRRMSTLDWPIVAHRHGWRW